MYNCANCCLTTVSRVYYTISYYTRWLCGGKYLPRLPFPLPDLLLLGLPFTQREIIVNILKTIALNNTFYMQHDDLIYNMNVYKTYLKYMLRSYVLPIWFSYTLEMQTYTGFIKNTYSNLWDCLHVLSKNDASSCFVFITTHRSTSGALHRILCKTIEQNTEKDILLYFY